MSNRNFAAERRALEKDHAQRIKMILNAEEAISRKKGFLGMLRHNEQDLVNLSGDGPPEGEDQLRLLEANGREQKVLTHHLETIWKNLAQEFSSAWQRRFALEAQWAGLHVVEDRAKIIVDQLYGVIARQHQLGLLILDREEEEEARRME